MTRCPSCFAPLTSQGCLCSGSERRLAQRPCTCDECRDRVLLPPPAGETCEWHATEYGPLCGEPAVQTIMDAGHRYGVCRAHLKHAGRAQLAHDDEPVAPRSRFAPCEVCGTTKTAGMPCMYCATLAGRGAVSQRSLTARKPLIRGIDALGSLLRRNPAGPDE